MKPLPEIATYQDSAGERPVLETKLREVRFVALDTETTGLDISRDTLISIGAVGVREMTIDIDDSFETVMPVGFNTATVVIHGITREASRSGLPEPDALCGLLNLLGGDVIVGHHISHDIAMLNSALNRHFGITLHNDCVDTGSLAFWLDYHHREEAGHDLFASFTLDGLCEHFGLTTHDRHTATGDAFLTAQVFLKLLARLRAYEVHTLDKLLQIQAESESRSAL